MGPVTECGESLDASERTISLTLFARFAPAQSGPGAHSRSTSATATQAMPSPRPIQPMPSLVVALTLTGAESGLTQDPLHLGPVRADLRLLADQCRVDVHHPSAELAHDHRQQIDRVGVAPLLLLGREERPQVAQAGRARGSRR